MEKSLIALSEEYFKAAEDLDLLIKKYTTELNEAYNSNNYLKTYELKRKLKIFYDQKRETMTTAYKLSHYYDESDGGRETA